MDEVNSQLQAILSQIIERQGLVEHKVAMLLDHAQQMPRFFSPTHATLLLDLQARLKPATAVGAKRVRVGGDNDGGYVMVDHGLDDTTVYNFGIGQEVTWDQAMASRGNTIYQFDHTIDQPPPVNGTTVFKRVGLGATTNDTFVSLYDALTANQDQDRSDLLLNIDIEGGEWDILPTLTVRDLSPFSQIVIELHDLLRFITASEFRAKVVASLDSLYRTHQVVHVHANNWASRAIAGSVIGYDVLEVTLLRKSDWTFEEYQDTLPLALDRPNAPFREEYALGDWAHVAS
jgi:hypothetical protein